MRPKSLLILVVLVLSSLLAGPALAQEFAQGSRPSGMGMAYTAVGEGTGGIYFNPAGIASSMMFQLDGTYEYTPSGSALSAAVIDSKTNPDVAAGVAYSYFFGRDDFDDLSGHDIHLAIALPVIHDQISVGVGGRYLIVQGEDFDGESFDVMRGFTLNAGALFRAADMVEIGIAGRNLLNICKDNAVCGGIAPTNIAAGLSISDRETFVLAADGGIDLTSDPDKVQPFFQVGGEYFAGAKFPLRLGYQRLEATPRNMLTAGLGMRMKAAGLDAGFRMDLSQTDYFFVNGSFSLFF